MELNIVGEVSGQNAVQVSETVFGREFNQDLVHQVVVAYQAAARQGSKAQKNRAAVSGGGAKPWRQKGSGRARAGTSRSPIWRSGGVNFAAQPRSYEQKVNRKMYRAALQCIFSELVRQERLIVVESLAVDQPKTKLLLNELAKLDVVDALVVTEAMDMNLYLASRNLYGVGVVDAQGVDPVSLVGFQKVVITVEALKVIEESFS